MLQAQANGQTISLETCRAALLDSLDDDGLVNGASGLVMKGEELLTKFHEFRSSETLAQVMQHLENEDLERDVLSVLHQVQPEKLISSAEQALSSAEARDALVSQIKDTCLEFVLKILPAINIEKYAGCDNGCEWEINDISFSDVRFRKENVHITLCDPAFLGQPDVEVLQVSAWDISAHFKNMRVNVAQTAMPYLVAEGKAEARADRMTLRLAFRLVPSGLSHSAPWKLVVSRRSVEIETLDLTVTETVYAQMINALSYFFSEGLKEYACERICCHLDARTETLCNALNAALSALAPMLRKIGWDFLLPGTAPSSSELTTLLAPRALLRHKEGFDDFDWADPGRIFAIRP
jgi:hypothetical protein